MTACLDKFISENYDYLSRICCGYVGDELGDDLMHDLCVNVLENNKEKFSELCERGELMYYLLSVIRINAFSKTTRFYYKYKKHKEHEQIVPVNNLSRIESESIEDAIIHERMIEANKLLEGLPWFDSEVFKIYYLHSHSLNTLSDATGISRTTINQTLKRARRHIKAQKDKYAKATKAHDKVERVG